VTTMPESQRKKRKQSRLPPEDALVERVGDFLSARPGVTFETHMAGDWNELGFNVQVPETMTDRELLDLENALGELVAAEASAVKLPSSWIVGIYKEGELVAVIDPRSAPRRMCAVCGHIQGALLGDVCVSCGSEALS
jgi:hypothetical protein